jgi:hypothetical protein
MMSQSRVNNQSNDTINESQASGAALEIGQSEREIITAANIPAFPLV